MLDLSFSLMDLELFLLVMVRISCFVFTAPFYSINSVPSRYKIAFSIFVAYLVYSMVLPTSELEYDSVFEYAVIVGKEAIVGLLVGLGANICTHIISFAGRIIDMEMGLSMASVMDPTTREVSTMSGLLYNYLIMLILLLTGMYQYVLKALIETYQLIPVNGAHFSLYGILNAFLDFMSQFFVIGFQICLPVFAGTMILNAILGILAKVSPQINMFAVGLQLKIFMGLAIMFITIALLPYLSDVIFKEMKVMIVSMVEAMM